MEMLIVADNLHVIDPLIAAALEDMNPGPIQTLARKCLSAGAQALDINSGPLRRGPRKRFAFFVDAVQAVGNVPLVLDTTNPQALRAGLQACRPRVIINGFSAEPARIENILPLALEFDADIIGYLLRCDGSVPLEADEMMSLAIDLVAASSAAGLPSERLIIDPIIAPVSWEKGIQHNRAVLAVLAGLQELLGFPVRTIAGLSNLASGPVSVARKIALESAFLPMLAAAGLDMVMMNVLHPPCVRLARTCSALLSDRIFAWVEMDP
ncbi:MAG: dihydropteroate synthase [Desulfosarcinaceae bacterium]